MAVYESYVWLAMLYRSEAWCLKECEMGILQRSERSMVRAMCGMQLKVRKRSMDLVFMLGLKETMIQLDMGSSVHWYGHMLRKENCHVLRRALDFEVEGQRKQLRPMRIWKKQVEEESMKVGQRRKDSLCCSKWSYCVNKIAAMLR